MLAFNTLGGLLLLGFLSHALAAQSSSPQTMNTVRVVDDAEPDNETAIGKTSQSLREIPQSVTVVARERIDQQALTSLPDLMKYVPGVNVVRFDGIGLFNQFNARGYTADSFLLDGLNVRADGNMADLDLAVFERVEVLRGPAGLFQGAGQPGVTVNLVRKRALADLQVQTLLGAGSWNNYRGEFDLTSALTEDGGVRARVVAAYEDRESHLEGVGGDKKIFYGTLEFDVTDNSTLSVGGTYQDVQAVLDQGLPAFADGRLLDVARSTAVIADWNTQDMQTAEAFGEWVNHFSNGGMLKLAVRRHERDMYYLSARANGLVGTDGTVRIQYVDNYSDKVDTTTDLFFSTPFQFGGQSHELLLGADYREGTTFSHHSDGTPTLANVYSYDRYISRPSTWVDSVSQRTRSKVEEYGIYSQVRLRPVERLSLSLGARLSWWDSVDRSAVTGLVTAAFDATSQFTPYAGLVFDLNSMFSLYASYTDIFKPQSERMVTGEQLRPRTGVQYETGLKGEFLDGLLNAHFAVFRINDENRALADPENLGFSVAAGEVRSEGAELEVDGQIADHWSLSAGYAFIETEYLRAAANQQGQAFAPFTPKHTLNLWTHYSFAGAFLPGFEVGAGVRSVSDFYAQSGTVRVEGDAYTVVSALVGYNFADHYRVALNVENLFDRKYYEKVSGPSRQNYYGVPLSFMLTLRTRF